MPFALVGASPYVTRDFLVQAKFIYLSPAAHFSPAASLPGFSGYGRGLFQSGGWGGGCCRGDSSSLTLLFLLGREHIFLTSMGRWEGCGGGVEYKEAYRAQTSPFE